LHDHIDVLPNQLLQQRWEPLASPICPTVLDRNVLALYVPHLSEALAKGIEEMPVRGQGASIDEANAIHLPGLLCLDGRRYPRSPTLRGGQGAL